MLSLLFFGETFLLKFSTSHGEPVFWLFILMGLHFSQIMYYILTLTHYAGGRLRNEKRKRRVISRNAAERLWRIKNACSEAERARKTTTVMTSRTGPRTTRSGSVKRDFILRFNDLIYLNFFKNLGNIFYEIFHNAVAICFHFLFLSNSKILILKSIFLDT